MAFTGSNPPGDPVSPANIPFPTRHTLQGRYTTLAPLSPSHTSDIYSNICGAANDALWIFLPGPPPLTIEETTTQVKTWTTSPEMVFFAVQNPEGETLGVMAFLNIVPEHRRLEIGWVVLGPKLQKTRMATEAFYLMMKEAFGLGYDRVEWKANALNKGSLSAAARLGFAFEGTFRKHVVVKGKRRDSAYFSIVDDEWPAAQKGFEAWLDESNFDAGGKQKRGLKELRESCK